MTDASKSPDDAHQAGIGARQPTGLWTRFSRRGKILIVVDLAVLIMLAAIGAALLINSNNDSAAPSSVEPSPSTVRTPASSSPFETSQGLAWIVAACGGPMLVSDLPDPPLPHADRSGVCLRGGGQIVVVGVSADPSTLQDDVARLSAPHRRATRIDPVGNTWMFLIEGESPDALAPLERYGFKVQ